MDASACRVVYIDDRFHTERWLSRDGLSTSASAQRKLSADISELPPDLQANVNAILSVFSQGMSRQDCSTNVAMLGSCPMRTAQLTRFRNSIRVQLWSFFLFEIIRITRLGKT